MLTLPGRGGTIVQGGVASDQQEDDRRLDGRRVFQSDPRTGGLRGMRPGATRVSYQFSVLRNHPGKCAAFRNVLRGSSGRRSEGGGAPTPLVDRGPSRDVSRPPPRHRESDRGSVRPPGSYRLAMQREPEGRARPVPATAPPPRRHRSRAARSPLSHGGFDGVGPAGSSRPAVGYEPRSVHRESRRRCIGIAVGKLFRETFGKPVQQPVVVVGCTRAMKRACADSRCAPRSTSRLHSSARAGLGSTRLRRPIAISWNPSCSSWRTASWT